MELTDAASRLIVALDFPAADSGLALVDALGDRLKWVKVGLELYLAAGPRIVEELRARGLQVFLDLKLHDIPNTVAGAVQAVKGSGAELLTVHTLGGPAMLAAAQQAAGASVGILGVTILTSIEQAQLDAIGLREAPAQSVERLARLAVESGMRGMVCSPLEVAALRREFGAKPLLVVPGIRPLDAAAGDQRRTATPGDALRAGASLLVVGRPITQAKYPKQAFEAILAEITDVL